MIQPRTIKQIKKKIGSQFAPCQICGKFIDLDKCDPEKLDFVKPRYDTIKIYHRECIIKVMKGGD